MQFYVSLCICSCAVHRFFFAWCASTHFMEIIAGLVCAITALPTSFLKPSVIPLEIFPSTGCSNIDMKDVWKAVTKQSDALPSFANCWNTWWPNAEFSCGCNNLLIFWLEHSFVHSLQDQRWMNYVNPILLHSVSSAFQLSSTGIFFSLVLMCTELFCLACSVFP